MSIDFSGQDAKLKSAIVSVPVSETHPLLKLSNALPWPLLMQMVLPDLKKTTKKGFWFLGRKLYLRIHLAIYILQKIYNLTDRKVEYGVKDNVPFMLFTGCNIVSGWHAPDHTKIEEFRNRLFPETQRRLANEIAKIAVDLGFADPREVDFDSTVQEANIAYPSDASLMGNLAGLGKKVLGFLQEKAATLIPEGLSLDFKAIKAKVRNYFFLSKNTCIEKKREFFEQLHHMVKEQMSPVIQALGDLDLNHIAHLPWNIRRSLNQITTHGKKYLEDVAHFIKHHTISPGKIMSFHAQAVACIKKGKLGKIQEFGRVFQLGRIKGNFLFALKCSSVRMEDKASFQPLLAEHSRLFGKGTLDSLATDKGYWSMANYKSLQEAGASEIGLQAPKNIKCVNLDCSQEIQEKLRNRRAGIEPLIGHAKFGGQLGRSRMKSDQSTLSAGYSSILGLNLRQMSRNLMGKVKKAA